LPIVTETTAPPAKPKRVRKVKAKLVAEHRQSAEGVAPVAVSVPVTPKPTSRSKAAVAERSAAVKNRKIARALIGNDAIVSKAAAKLAEAVTGPGITANLAAQAADLGSRAGKVADAMAELEQGVRGEVLDAEIAKAVAALDEGNEQTE